MITAAYPQIQTRPAERKITKKYDDSSLLRHCAVSTGEELPTIRRGAGFRSSRGISPGGYVENDCTALLVSRTWNFKKNTSCSHVIDVEPSPTVFSGNEGEGIADKALSVLCLKDVSGIDNPSSVALEILVKTGQCLAKFHIDTPTRIYICKAFILRLHQIQSLKNSDNIVNVYFFLQCIKQYCKTLWHRTSLSSRQPSCFVYWRSQDQSFPRHWLYGHSL